MNFYLNKFFILLLCIVFSIGSFSCKKNKKSYLYEVVPVSVKKERGNKSVLKTPSEFISLAHNDIVGKAISSTELANYLESYNYFGDKHYTEKLILKKLLQNKNIPGEIYMRTDAKRFIIAAFKNFYYREPTEYEVEYLSGFIKKYPSFTSNDFYFYMLSGAEYRYF
jgi:hypothetical protein